jgi:dihydroneopterin aldolase
MSLAVYKLGGSLLDLPDLGERIKNLWETRPASETRLLIVGGGQFADIVREWDARFRLGDEDAHELAVLSLRLSEELIDRMIPRLHHVCDRTDVTHLQAGETGLVSVGELLEAGEEEGHFLPRNWEFTTDAISAWIADYVGADELVLLKSVDCPEAATVSQLSRDKFVDGEFPKFCRGNSPVTWINLRSDELRPVAIGVE